MIVKFVNLTNGIEAIRKYNLSNYSFVRIQSTTIEQKNWYKFFIDIDHNLLMNLAIGNMCLFYDFGCRRPISKTIYYGLPLLKYCLNKYWFNYEEHKVFIGRNLVNCKNFVEDIYNKYFIYHSEKYIDAKIQITSKYKYYRKFTSLNNRNSVYLLGYSDSTNNDSNNEYYKSILE